MGMGADVSGAGTLRSGLIFAALIVPVFVYRHYIQDKGKFPASMAQDLALTATEAVTRRAGVLPYLALALGALVLYITHRLAVY